MSAVRVSIDLPAPPDEVWDVIMDPHQMERWVTIQRELTAADDGPPRVGFTMAQRYAIRGAPVNVSWVLESLDRPRTAVWRGTGPAGASALIEYHLVPVADGTRTRFDYVNDFAAPMGLLGRVASRALMGGTPEREAVQSLELLRDLLAARHTA